MSSATLRFNHTPAGDSKIPPITAELVGLNDAIFKPIREAVGFLSATRRFPDSSIPENQRPSLPRNTPEVLCIEQNCS